MAELNSMFYGALELSEGEDPQSELEIKAEMEASLLTLQLTL
jgi:hypothetical protein